MVRYLCEITLLPEQCCHGLIPVAAMNAIDTGPFPFFSASRVFKIDFPDERRLMQLYTPFSPAFKGFCWCLHWERQAL